MKKKKRRFYNRRQQFANTRSSKNGIVSSFYISQSGRCIFCGKKMLPPSSKNEDLSPSLEHLIPLSKGGKQRDINNLVVSCRKCNADKDNQDLTPWFQSKSFYNPSTLLFLCLLTNASISCSDIFSKMS